MKGIGGGRDKGRREWGTRREEDRKVLPVTSWSPHLPLVMYSFHAELAIGFDNDAVEVSENIGLLEVCLEASTGDFFGSVDVDLTFESATAQGSTNYSSYRLFNP